MKIPAIAGAAVNSRTKLSVFKAAIEITGEWMSADTPVDNGFKGGHDI